jgi:hypothetical protein
MKFCSISARFVLQCPASDESLLSEALESQHFKEAVRPLRSRKEAVDGFKR